MAYETELARYDALNKEYEKKNRNDLAKQKATTESAYNEQLKQAYISNMQNRNMLNENLAKSGVRGGISETTNLGLATNYQNTRNAINSERNSAIQAMNNSANDNLFNYKQATDQAKIQYTEQREAEDRQIKREKDEKASAVKTEYLTQKYGQYYSVDTLKEKYKNATTQEEKAIILARINYLNQHKKGY